MTTLIIAEHDNASLKSATAHAVGAAARIGGDVHVLVAGANAQAAAAEAAKLAGVGKVLLADAPYLAAPTAENVAATALSILPGGYTHVIVAATGFGKNVAPRIAAKLDVAQVSDVTAIEAADIFVRPIYAGNAFATVQSKDPVKVVTIRTTGFDAAASTGAAPVETIAAAADTGASRVTGQELTKSERPELTSARIVISGGRGLGSGENFKILEALADKLQAAIGASGSLLIATITLLSFMPARCWIAPEIPTATYRSGATILPV